MLEQFIVIIIGIFISIEIFTYFIISNVNNKFQWLIMKKDEFPNLSEKGLKKFFEHGYDSELGWIRKPNTLHSEIGKNGQTKWTVNSKGFRTNPEYDNLESKIS